MNKFLGAVATILMCCVVGVALYFGFNVWTAHQRQLQRAADIGSVSSSTKAAQAEGHDAAEAITNSAEFEAASRAITQSNASAIRAAKGSEVPVTPMANDAGLRALCRRVVYRNDPRCVQLRHPGS